MVGNGWNVRTMRVGLGARLGRAVAVVISAAASGSVVAAYSFAVAGGAGSRDENHTPVSRSATTAAAMNLWRVIERGL